jgi:predicted type IV restriction endonuclease
MAIPNKIIERVNKNLSKFQNALKTAKDKDLNEADTVQIISDILADVFGYDKYLEVTSELMIRGTYCDLAIKIKGKFQFIIECKAIGIDLKDNHLRQAVDYGAKLGVSWVVLTNGLDWQIYKIRFEKPIDYDLVCSFNFMDVSAKRSDDMDKLFILCREGLAKDHRENFYDKTQSVNKFVIGAFILSDPIVSAIRKEMRKYSDGLKVENDEIEKIIQQEVLRRELLESEDAAKILARIKRYYNRQGRRPVKRIAVKRMAVKVADTETIENEEPNTEE